MEQQRPTGEQMLKMFKDFQRIYPADYNYPFGGGHGAIVETHRYLLHTTRVYANLTAEKLYEDRTGLVLPDYELCRKFFAIQLRMRKNHVLELDSKLNHILLKTLPKTSVKSAIKKL